MSDLIDRQAAIDAVGYYSLHSGDKLLFADKPLRELPSVQPEWWIPCSRRMPKDYENVLVYFEYYRYGDYNCMFSTYGIGDYSSEYDSWLVNGETGWQKLHVFAWMPLPDPYKEAE